MNRTLKARAACGGRSFAIVLSCLAVLAGASASAADSVTATITYPAAGATGVVLSQPIQWTPIAGVQTYYLYVGTTVGAKDLVNSGEIAQTSFQPGDLPLDRVLFARLWTKVAGVWRFADSSFSVHTVSPVAAAITAPANGTTTADFSQPIRWTTVQGAQAYYLYVGTSVGAKDLVDSGETAATTYSAATLPANRTLYARLWTRVSNRWVYKDSSFSGAAISAVITVPAIGSTTADWTIPIQWTTFPGAQAYYLYVGTTPGAKDLINTGEIQQTSFPAANLPANQIVYARLWTRVANSWRYTDSSFRGGTLSARVTSPADRSTGVPTAVSIQWTSVPGVQTYYLYVGTTIGAKDLVNSGEIHQTQFFAKALPGNQTVYARIWTKAGDVWRYADSQFTTLALATLSFPADGAVNVDKSKPATWNSVPHATGYYLYVGTAPGLKDLLDSSETTLTSFSILGVPAAVKVYARLWTELDGHWRYVDSTFSAGAIAPEFVWPRNGATNVDASQPFQWTPPIGAQTHRLTVGSTPGGNDLLDSGEMQGTLHPGVVSSRRTLYARVSSKVNGQWARHSDIAFSPRIPTRPGAMIAPRDGDLDFDAAQGFRWRDAPLAQAYRLVIGTGPSLTDVHDSGLVQVTRRFVSGMPVGVPLFGQLQTQIDGQWYITDFGFTVGQSQLTTASQIDAAAWAVDVVRNMAPDNRPYQWSGLHSVVAPRYNAVCSDFAEQLLRMLSDMNLTLPSRRLVVSFNGTNLDSHTLVEMLDPATQRWMILDPTFDLMAKNADGSWAGADDISQATRQGNWTAITYVFLGAAGDDYARGYYADYPLLFVNVQHQGDPVAPPNTVLPYLQEITVPVAGGPQIYIVGCSGAASSQVVVDNAMTVVPCGGTESTSAMFFAAAIAAPAGSPAQFRLFQPRRFLF